MRNLIILIGALTVFSGKAFAGNYSNFTCKEIHSRHHRVMTLEQVGKSDIKEGIKYPFIFRLFQEGEKNPSITARVLVQTEDVMFNFETAHGRISGVIFLDEADQTSVKIDGEDLRFSCE